MTYSDFLKERMIPVASRECFRLEGAFSLFPHGSSAVALRAVADKSVANRGNASRPSLKIFPARFYNPV
jgi:hypothetical protein